MDKKFACLKLLSSLNKSNWKIGQTDSYINMVSKRASALPENVFDRFSLESDASKKISIIDFAILTYDMPKFDKELLMNEYGINPGDVIAVLKAADDLATDFEKKSAQEYEL